MKKFFVLTSSILMLGLSACLESQTAPNLPSLDQSDFTIDILAKDMKHPWAVAELPDGGFLITERGGRLYRHSETGQVEIKGLPSDILADGQGGLLDVVLAPDFAESAEVYLSYAYGTLDSNGTALMKARLDGDTLEDPNVIFRANPPKQAFQHFGGRIAFLPDESVILTLGDGFAFREDAQKPGTHLGKIVRLTENGDVPADNPYLGQDEFKPEIYSIGHRNVQGLAFDSETQTLWSHEHGPRGGDELNNTKPGQNYGWPIATKGTDYQGAKISPFKTYDGMENAVHGWTPSIAPSGLAIYRGDLFPDWNGDALVGGLASRDLRVVELANGQSVGEIDLLSDMDERIRDVRVARDGAILILTDDAEKGKLLRLSPKK